MAVDDARGMGACWSERGTMSAFGILVPEQVIRVFDRPVSKHEALRQLAEAVAATGAISNADVLVQAIEDRETVMSTGIGGGVAIPHVRIDEVTRPTVSVGISHDGIDYDALDNEPVHLLALFAMPTGSQREYLGLLASVMGAMKEPAFTARLLACRTPAEAAALLNADG